MNQLPRLIRYLRRYWILLVLWLASLALAFYKPAVLYVGTIVYLPMLALGALLTALLMRNVFNTDTTDAESDSGQFVVEWKALPSHIRVILTVVQILVYYLGAALIAAALINL